MSEGMHHAEYSSFSSQDREEVLQTLIDSYSALSTDQDNWICNLSNASSLLWHAYRSLNVNVNWTGFYVTNVEDKELILGPFQGKVACQLIAFGRGVCGAAAESQETQLVKDVNKFPGHIACDGETKSEIVVPIVNEQGKTLGVIDLDCLDYEGFGEVDKKYLEELSRLIVKTCKF
ncbi:hypothetical protein Kpol_1073p21 [Vanderwaltozyma polyspora DSM 70294]|uniref:GAF domain-containing protein n=1 Tax=Vanderwaltozyma polyspora (strain ATCC 22028 / DSM 70294 / BCRC 21397 / CBS 2163 / NBRC 10782 / NRRL Y-8283 / UCD 57-17) TaxID=436907 RepID=A7TPT2_VANPO|nr:uncharacterized protein Kpol_1073p21 [Vanderwaltozyma polyspora DSM 70294]EDO15733.1 hypothetical protein Kpol_1073p21 [Vanderwaltozyma polyspora DSM 70294]